MLKLWVLEAQPSSLASHIHRMVKDEDNHLENKGLRGVFLVFFWVAAGVSGRVVWNFFSLSLGYEFKAVPCYQRGEGLGH